MATKAPPSTEFSSDARSLRWLKRALQNDGGFDTKERTKSFWRNAVLPGLCAGVASVPGRWLPDLVDVAMRTTVAALFSVIFTLPFLLGAAVLDRALNRSVVDWYTYMLDGNGTSEDLYARQQNAARWVSRAPATKILVLLGPLLSLVFIDATGRLDQNPRWLLLIPGVLGLMFLVSRMVDWAASDRMHAVAWSAIIGAETKLREDQAGVAKNDWEVAPDVQVNLEQLELLRIVATTALPIDRQLVRLGLRPTQINPYLEGEENEDQDAVHSNAQILAALKVLIELGALHVRTGRLVVSATGREQLALPAAIFAAKLPAAVRIRLARADLKFSTGDYEGCAGICGPVLEEFLKEAIDDLLPRRARQVVLGAIGEKAELEKVALGNLAFLLTAILGSNHRLTDKKQKDIDRLLEDAGVELTKVRQGFGNSNARQLAGMLDACVPYRNQWAHHQSEPIGAREQAESAYTMLQLTRMVISTCCQALASDPTVKLAPATSEVAS